MSWRCYGKCRWDNKWDFKCVLVIQLELRGHELQNIVYMIYSLSESVQSDWSVMCNASLKSQLKSSDRLQGLSYENDLGHFCAGHCSVRCSHLTVMNLPSLSALTATRHIALRGVWKIIRNPCRGLTGWLVIVKFTRNVHTALTCITYQ